MCSMSVLCPLCAQTSFSSIDALRCSLIKAANGPLACPICHELFLGLDKLTIHLFSHTNIMNSTNNNSNNNSNSNNNNNIIKTPTIIPKSDNENFKNIEKLKRQEIENQNHLNNNCNDVTTTTTTTTTTTSSTTTNNISIPNTPTHFKKNELNFDRNIQQSNYTHHLSGETKNILIKKPKVATKTDKKIINKTNTIQIQHHQQVAENKRETEELEGVQENLAQCDICEFTFRNEDLRNMHIRLVHQNFDCHTNPSDTILNSNKNNSSSLTALTTEDSSKNSSLQHEFKCHLCAKTFKMKGSLRVHLKVVHLMGLPHANNGTKLSICDRIRHKENKSNSKTNATNFTTQIPTETSNTTSPTLLTNNLKAPIPPANNLYNNIAPVNFISNISSLPSSSTVGVLNLNQSLDISQNNLDNSALQSSNVLLVFNTSASADLQKSLNSLANNLNANTTNAVVTTSSIADKDISPKLSANMSSVTENPKIWECDVCSKAFTTKYFLKKHKRLHTGEMPYTCELCARTFTFQQSYHKHLLYHSDEKPHVCSTCGRAFKELSTLHNHERIHSGEKPFKCEVCGKSFRQRVSFLVHTRIHTGVMPYKCETCQRSFRYKVSQRTHKCQPLSPEESSPTPPPTNEENTIDHMSENFIKAFLENSAASRTESHLNQSHNSPASNEIAAINEKATSLNEQQALLTKTIDDIVVESCNKMGIISEGFTTDHIVNEGSMSPSQRLQNMRLYSPQLVTPDLNVMEGDLTRFFLENSQAANNLL